MAAASNNHGKSGSRSDAQHGLGSAVQAARLPALISFLALCASIATGCTPGDDTNIGGAPSGTGGFGGSTGGAGGDGPCEDGATQDCHITLGQHGSVLSCYSGTQTCSQGEWGPCVGAQSDHPAPPPPPAGPCQNNPCDPSCQVFDQTPGQPIGSPPQNLIAPWLVGNYGGLPPALQAQMSGEPCSDGSACQSDQFCNNPSSNTCSHTKCVAGAGLRKSCDPCVQQICISNPGCCNDTIPAGVAPCAHDLCETGVALAKTDAVAGTTACDSCVNTVCNSTPWNQCCNTATGAWTAECVDRVSNPSVCNKNCSTGTWSNSCVALVDTLCNAKCLADTTPPTCAHDKCYLGDALSSACDPCVTQICANAATASCCSGGAGAWTGACLQAVATVCGETCPAKGDCVPWLPTQKDPGCGGAWDLTVGVGCTDAGVPSVPVCNRGQAASPAGLSLFAGATGIPNSISPNLGGATLVTLPAIAAGACSNVNLPVNTPEGALLVANPGNAGGAGGVYNNSECHNNNNWGVWSTGTGACAEPTCAGASAFSKLKKIKLFFSVDVSQSMSKSVVTGALNTEPSRWTYLKSALNGFMTTAPDDTAVWMRFWPNNDPNPAIGACPQPLPTTGCGPVPGCKNPNIDVGDLTAANETAVVNTINNMVLFGVTPMFPALDAATQRAVEFQQANPDWNAVVILVTDGNPTLCILTPSKIAGLAGQAYQGYGVRTYTIGIAEVAEATVNQIAGAGGGKSFFINTNNAMDFQTQLVSALNSIKNDFVSCTLPLPNQNIFDPTKALITYTPGMGAASNLPQVANAASCAGAGWFYDNPMNPTSITLCPTTCSDVKLDTNGKLELKIDCIKQYLPSTTTETYEATCPQGTVPQWGFLGYDTTDPGDSSIKFRVQTSDDNITYGPLTAVVATATSTPDTQICKAPTPGCPVDLFTPLGGSPAVHKKYLRLQADIKPTTDKLKTPTLNSWQVTYSCPDSE